MSCEYCEKGALLVSASSWHSSKGDFYPGISVGIDGDELWIEATPDTYEPGYMEEYIKINFCPMCGTRLSEENL